MIRHGAATVLFIMSVLKIHTSFSPCSPGAGNHLVLPREHGGQGAQEDSHTATLHGAIFQLLLHSDLFREHAHRSVRDYNLMCQKRGPFDNPHNSLGRKAA